MSELDQKDQQKKKQQQDQERKRRADADDQDAAGDATNLLPWDPDVEEFMERLELVLRGFRASMSSAEFRQLVLEYRELSLAEKRAVANRLRKRHLDGLLQALHAGDYRLYVDSWQADAERARVTDGERPRAPEDDKPDVV